MKNNLPVIYAWTAMLVFSILPEIIWGELLGSDSSWILTARLVVLAVLILVALLVPGLRSLWKYPAVLIAIVAAGWIMDLTLVTTWREDLLRWINPSPVRSLFVVQFSKLGATAIVLLVLFALRFRRKDAFLALGDLRAMAAPVRWLGFPKPEPWTSFGTKWLLFLSIGMVVILAAFGGFNPQALVGALVYIPVVLLLAVLNAFNEEVLYRSAQFAPLVGSLSDRQVLILTSVLFGIAHFYGVPYGVAGVLLSTFMGWMLGKAMLETRGFFWPWLIHVVVDIWIFYFILAGTIVPGG